MSKVKVVSPQQIRLELCEVCDNRFVVRGNPIMNETLLCDYCWAKDWGKHHD